MFVLPIKELANSFQVHSKKDILFRKGNAYFFNLEPNKRKNSDIFFPLWLTKKNK